MARPTVMTPETIAKLEEAFAWGCTDREACLWANISEDTLYLHQRENPEFIKRKESLKDTVILKSRKSVHDRVIKGDVDTSKWVLERKKKDEYSTKVENDLRVKELPKPIMEFTDELLQDDSN
jgi:hypothetical protein